MQTAQHNPQVKCPGENSRDCNTKMAHHALARKAAHFASGAMVDQGSEEKGFAEEQ